MAKSSVNNAILAQAVVLSQPSWYSNLMILTQDEANIRARELAAKYDLATVFSSEDPQEIAFSLWQVAKDPFDVEEYEKVLEMVELSYYLDPNYYYAYIIGVANFYRDKNQETVAFFEYSLEQIAQKSPLYQPLSTGLNLELILTNLYRMLIQSNIEVGRYDEAIAVWDATSTLYRDESSPDFFVMVAQILATSGRIQEAMGLLERATVLAEKIDDIAMREDSLRDINRLLQAISEISTDESTSNEL